ncbi:MAG: hypothetical protein PHP98_06525 [Kiritimatiellae bacterium]|nr:hypothetical protein [Kiritimatiellia bacterium]
MTARRIGLFSFVITLGVWAWFSWPLPRYLTSGIPAAAHLAPAEAQPLIPGDHLQFMYYCWLAGDMIFGKTPLFCNPYEFNTGSDRAGLSSSCESVAALKSSAAGQDVLRGKGENYRPDAYYFPFSLVYSVLALTAGRAFGWNLTGLLSLWMTFFLAWLLVRRYCRPDWLAACAALIAITLPFRWINLFGGSPAGFACVWIPAVLLGIDLAVRAGKPSGGLLAGVSLLFASWTDNHVFFFGALVSPFWALVAAAAGPDASKTRRHSWQKVFTALLPIPLFLGGALAFPALMQMFAGAAAANQHLTASASLGARAWREVALYSPQADGFFGWLTSGVSSHIYLGLTPLAFLAAGAAGLIWAVVRRSPAGPRRLLVMVLMLAALAGIMALALGTNGPEHAVLFRICRKIIPPYAFIRQPAKIFCLMPPLLAAATGLALSAVFVHVRARPIKILLAAVFCAAVAGEHALRVNPTVSLLDDQQGAYAAVAEDAAAAGKAPHALVVILWPGDSHYSSVYQYYASLYRVRMVNGYNPFVSKYYFDNVFRRYESANQGRLTDEQIDGLLRRGIEYVILHEDLFPEKVSPFPVGFTLQQFLAHPRLRVIRQDGRVWAFKMLPGPVEKDELKTDHWVFGCARHWVAENCAGGKTRVSHDDLNVFGSYTVLSGPGSWLAVPALRVAPSPHLRWMMRARGAGAVVAVISADGKAVSRDLIDIQSDDWAWIDIPIDHFDHFNPLGLKIEYESGAVECSRILLTAGPWVTPCAGRTIDLPAPGMFHAGYTSLDGGAVVLEKEREAKALIFYGPKMPLEKGRYRIELIFNSDAPRGVLLGQFNVKRHDRDCILNWVPVVAGARSLTEFVQPQNVPMYLEFRFLGRGNLRINGIRITRLE